MKVPVVYLVAGGAVAAALLWAWSKGAKAIGASAAGVVIDLVDGAVSETVFTVSDAVGIPRTDKIECQRRVDEFNAAPWYEQAALSFGLVTYCSVPDYARYVTTGKGPLDP